MNIKKTSLDGCLIIKSQRFLDSRGYFEETFHQSKLKNFLPKNTVFVQDNLSLSKKNVLRGIHIQLTKPQGKLVRVVKGEVIDIAVDLRKSSKTFGKHFSVILSSERSEYLWIPEGFGHAFLSLKNDSILEYKCTNFYDSKDEVTLNWDDESIKINWPKVGEYKISKKDKLGISLQQFKSYIK